MPNNRLEHDAEDRAAQPCGSSVRSEDARRLMYLIGRMFRVRRIGPADGQLLVSLRLADAHLRLSGE